LRGRAGAARRRSAKRRGSASRCCSIRHWLGSKTSSAISTTRRYGRPKQSISRAELRTPDCSPKDGQLLTQRQVVERDGPVSATDQPERSEQYDNRSACAILSSVDLGINQRG